MLLQVEGSTIIIVIACSLGPPLVSSGCGKSKSTRGDEVALPIFSALYTAGNDCTYLSDLLVRSEWHRAHT